MLDRSRINTDLKFRIDKTREKLVEIQNKTVLNMSTDDFIKIEVLKNNITLLENLLYSLVSYEWDS